MSTCECKVALAIIPAEIAERLRTHPAPPVRSLAATVFGNSSAGPTAEFARHISAVESALRTGPGNPYTGETLFMQRCAACHKLFFKGGNVGPDLTSYQRDNLGTMLLSIVNPNAEIREGFQYTVAETKDGRTVSGFVVDRDNQVTVLRGLAGENITLRADNIKSIEPMGQSLMPAGLLDGLDDQQLRDFFAYLRISQPISN